MFITVKDALRSDGEKRIIISPSSVDDARRVLHYAVDKLMERSLRLAEAGQREWPDDDRLRIIIDNAAAVLADADCAAQAETVARRGRNAAVVLTLRFRQADMGPASNHRFPPLEAFGGLWSLRSAVFLGAAVLEVVDGAQPALPAAR